MERFQLPADSLAGVATVLADGGYTGVRLAAGVLEVLGAQVEIATRSELHTFAVIPKQWVVERSFGWGDKVSPTLETWRTAVEHFSSTGRVGFPFYPPKKILNRL